MSVHQLIIGEGTVIQLDVRMESIVGPSISMESVMACVQINSIHTRKKGLKPWLRKLEISVGFAGIVEGNSHLSFWLLLNKQLGLMRQQEFLG